MGKYERLVHGVFARMFGDSVSHGGVLAAAIRSGECSRTRRKTSPGSRDSLAAPSLAIISVVAIVLAGGTTPVRAQTAADAVETTFGDHPTVTFGTIATLEGVAKFQLDWRQADEASAVESWDVHLMRVGISGRLFKRVEYQIERQLNDDTSPWRDVYADVAVSSALQARGGKFKIPFGLDMLTSAMQLDFVYRSLAASSLAPGRDVGVEIHGRLFARALRYDVGVFRHGGDNVRASERLESDRTWAARVTVAPWQQARGSPWRDLTLGGGMTGGDLPEGLHTLDSRTVFDSPLFPKVYVNGARRRIGGDAEWRNGPFGVRGEFIHVRDTRRGEGTDDEDLPDLYSRGGYVSGTWVVTGEKKGDTVKPKRPLPRGGFGAVEVAGRIEWIGFGTEGEGDASAGPRAAHLADQGARVVTLGINWYLNRFVRLQANAIRERRPDVVGGVSGEHTSWSPVIRFQLGL